MHLVLQRLSLHLRNYYLSCRSYSDLSRVRVPRIRFCINTVQGNGLFSKDLAQSQVSNESEMRNKTTEQEEEMQN